MAGKLLLNNMLQFSQINKVHFIDKFPIHDCSFNLQAVDFPNNNHEI